MSCLTRKFRRGRFYRELGLAAWLGRCGERGGRETPATSRHVSQRGAARGNGRGRRRNAPADGARHPHVRRAYLIGKTINLGQAEAACFSDILDGLSAGMILVDGIGRVVHANAAGNAIVGAADFLRTMHGRLVAGDASTNAAFREILATADAETALSGARGYRPAANGA